MHKLHLDKILHAQCFAIRLIRMERIRWECSGFKENMVAPEHCSFNFILSIMLSFVPYVLNDVTRNRTVFAENVYITHTYWIEIRIIHERTLYLEIFSQLNQFSLNNHFFCCLRTLVCLHSFIWLKISKYNVHCGIIIPTNTMSVRWKSHCKSGQVKEVERSYEMRKLNKLTSSAWHIKSHFDRITNNIHYTRIRVALHLWIESLSWNESHFKVKPLEIFPNWKSQLNAGPHLLKFSEMN